MRIAVIGCGYVGLVSGACLADSGHQVTRVDVDTNKIVPLKKARLPFFEPGLAGLVERNVVRGQAVKPYSIRYFSIGRPEETTKIRSSEAAQ